MATRKATTTYTLEMFAATWLPLSTEHTRKNWARNYRAACRWNDRVARLLADETPWHQRPIPVTDWSPKGMRAWHRAQMDPVIRDMYAALDTDGRAYRLFAAACRAAA